MFIHNCFPLCPCFLPHHGFNTRFSCHLTIHVHGICIVSCYRIENRRRGGGSNLCCPEHCCPEHEPSTKLLSVVRIILFFNFIKTFAHFFELDMIYRLTTYWNKYRLVCMHFIFMTGFHLSSMINTRLIYRLNTKSTQVFCTTEAHYLITHIVNDPCIQNRHQILPWESTLLLKNVVIFLCLL